VVRTIDSGTSPEAFLLSTLPLILEASSANTHRQDGRSADLRFVERPGY
jgi:hypothetical protein